MSFAVISAICICVLLGWILDVPVLRKGIQGSGSVNPVAALTFLLAMFSLHLLSRQNQNVHIYGSATGLLVCLIGSIRMFEFIADTPLGISQWLFAQELAKELTPNIMAPSTGFCFMMTGVSLILYGLRVINGRRITASLSLIVLMIALFSVVGYLYDAPEFYNSKPYIPMAFPSSICFTLFSASVLINSSRRLRYFLRSPLQGSKMARFLLPFAILVPVLTGKLRVYGQEHNLYSTGFGTGLFALVTVGLLVLQTNNCMQHKEKNLKERKWLTR